MTMEIKPFAPGQEKELNSLICSVFDEFIGYEYSEEGNRVFKDYIAPENIAERHEEGNIILTCREGERIVGMIEIRENNHICLFFVEKGCHGKGYGRALFDGILSEVRGRTDFIEVNSSLYARDIYYELGFRETGEKTEKNGIIYIPMKKKV